MKKCMALLALGAASVASAQQTNEWSDLTPIIVSASRMDTPIEQIGTSTAIVNAQTIEQKNAQNVQSALRQTAGLQFTSSGGPGTASSTYIRGANANHTLVLINGIRVNGNTTGAFNLSTLPTDAIDHVEVLRGPQSALYGSDAIGGVINIVTKSGKEAGNTAHLYGAYGEKGYYRGNIGLSLADERMDLQATLATAGLSKYDISQNYGGTEDDEIRTDSFHGNLGLNFMDDGRLDVSLFNTKSKNDIDQYAPWPGWSQVDDEDRSTEKELTVTSAQLEKPITDLWVQKFVLGLTKENTIGNNDGSKEYEYNSQNIDFSAQSDLYLSGNDTLAMGYDFRRSEADNTGNYDTEHRTQHALFINNMINYEEMLFFNLGARYDDFSDIDGRGTWKAALALHASESTRLHGSAGTAYKAPTMNDLYWPTVIYPPSWGGGGSGGNPDLDPERSQAFDIGVEQSFWDRKIITDVTLFHNEIKNLIEWAQDDTGFWSPRNVNAAKTKGIETSLAITPLDWFSTRIHYTYTDAKDLSTGNELARRAKHTGGINVLFEVLQYATINADFIYVGERFDNTANTRTLDEYGLLNLNITGHLTPNWDVTLNADNVFDKYYENAAGYGTVGRVVSLGTSYTF